MQLKLKTILNLKEKYSHFVYQDVRLNEAEAGSRIEITVVPCQGSKGICSRCNKPCAGYDHLKQREFIHVPLWGFMVVLLYCMRRLQCPTCGIVVESVPWSAGKSPLTKGYAWFLSEWAKLLSMQEVARQFKLTWHHVFTAVAMAVSWGRERIDLIGITAIGVDEIHWGKNSFMTLVYQIDNHCKRLLWCGEERTLKTINAFFDWFGEERSVLLTFICSDMWRPYLKAISLRAKDALNILDRFHISQKLSQAIDKVRAAETRLSLSFYLKYHSLASLRFSVAIVLLHVIDCLKFFYNVVSLIQHNFVYRNSANCIRQKEETQNIILKNFLYLFLKAYI